MTVLVTGGTGFIGSHLVRLLKTKKDRVVLLIHDEPIWDKWLTESLAGTVKVRGDIRDARLLKRILNEYAVTTVYHLAAQAIVKKAIQDPATTYDINVMGAVSVLDACREFQVPLVCQSTDKVYGEQENATTNSPLKPSDPYSTSKIAVDVMAQSYAKTYGMKIVITRPCNCYGLDKENRIVPNTLRKCLAGKPPVIFLHDESRRQYMYVWDAVDALWYVAEHDTPLVVNITTSTQLTQEEVVLTILKFFPGVTAQYREKPTVKEIGSQSITPTEFGHPGWTPRYSFEDGIKSTIQEWKQYYGDEQSEKVLYFVS